MLCGTPRAWQARGGAQAHAHGRPRASRLRPGGLCSRPSASAGGDSSPRAGDCETVTPEHAPVPPPPASGSCSEAQCRRGGVPHAQEAARAGRTALAPELQRGACPPSHHRPLPRHSPCLPCRPALGPGGGGHHGLGVCRAESRGTDISSFRRRGGADLSLGRGRSPGRRQEARPGAPGLGARCPWLGGAGT